MVERHLVERGLRTVNRARRALGLRPIEAFPGGIPGDVSHCMLSHSFLVDSPFSTGDIQTGSSRVKFPDTRTAQAVRDVFCALSDNQENKQTGLTVMLPRHLQRLVVLFDRGDFSPDCEVEFHLGGRSTVSVDSILTSDPVTCFRTPRPNASSAGE